MDALLITAGLVLLLILAGATGERGAGPLFGLLFIGALLYLIVRALV